MRSNLTTLPFGGGDAGERIRNLRRRKAPVWLTVAAAVACLALAVCLLTDREKDKEQDLDIDRNMLAASLHNLSSRVLVGEDGETVYFLVGDVHSSDRLLYVLDVPSGIVTPLCDKPECRHNSGSCNAWLGFNYSLQLYDGKIWFNDGYNVYRMDPDGRNRELVTAIDRELFFGETGASGNIFFHRGYIFHAMVGNGVLEGELGSEVRVYALPTDGQQEPEVILQKNYPGKFLSMEAQPAGDWLYFYLNYRDRRPETDDVGYELEIYRWSLTEHILETVYAAPQDDAILTLSNMWAQDDSVLFFGRGVDGTVSVYALDIASGEFARQMVLGDDDDFYREYLLGDRVVLCRRQENGDFRDENGRWYHDPEHWDMLVTVTDLEGNVLHENWITAPEFPELPASEDGTAPWRAFDIVGLSGDQLYAKYSVYDQKTAISKLFQIVRLDLATGETELLGGWTEDTQ